MARQSAHVIVFGNEKGGCGKSTTAMHVAVALVHSGYRVTTIDLDSRQLSLYTYVENRRRWCDTMGVDLPVPAAYAVPRADTYDIRLNETREFEAFADALGQAEAQSDFVVIDTPGFDSYLNRLAHSLADTLVSPINESYIDFDVFGRIDPVTLAVVRESHYADMVREGRRQRLLVDGGTCDWIVVRNRLSKLDSRNRRNITESMEILARRLNFRIADGMTERVVYREFFPLGLTALDPVDQIRLAGKASLSHLAARQEIRTLVLELRLPVDLAPDLVAAPEIAAMGPGVATVELAQEPG